MPTTAEVSASCIYGFISSGYKMDLPLTVGGYHIGLTTSNLEESARFFTALLSWKEIKRREDYPAIFVSDGAIMLTL